MSYLANGYHRFLFLFGFTLLNVLNVQTSFGQTSCGCRISILTCGVGEDLYSCYGHSAVRVIDTCTGTDIVYNYGTFNFSDPDFYWKFTRGKLQYYLNDESYNGFMQTYVSEGRSVHEQVLNLSDLNLRKLQSFLINNLKEENRYYKYDFLFDNCSTRIRDLFTKIFGERFEAGQAMANDSCSFRSLLDHYERNRHWERFGINLLMSDQVDQSMSNVQSMFLPDYLMKGLAGASIDGQALVKETNLLLAATQAIPTQVNQPKLILWLLFIVIFLFSFSKWSKVPLMYFDVLLFMLLGLLGCFMLFMWFGTEHKVCAWNRNLYWAFPLHLLFAFLIPLQSTKLISYAKYAGWLIVASFFYNLIAEQKFMSELTPLLLLILFRLGKYSKQVTYFSFNK